MMDDQVHYRFLRYRTNDDEEGKTRISIMPTVQPQHRNHGAHTPVPEPNHPRDQQEKHQGTQGNIKGPWDWTRCDRRSQRRLPCVELGPTTPPMLTNAGQLQSFISWDNFSHGFMAISWQTQQQQYYDNRQLQRSSTKWASEVLKWILKHARQQWDHQNDELHQQQPNQVKDLEVNMNIREE